MSRELILQMHVSVDGYVAGPDCAGFDVPDESAEALAWLVESLRAVGAHVMGGVTYREMAAHWPNADGDIAELMNAKPKIVFSTTLRDAAWPTTRVVQGDLAAQVAALKDEDGGALMAHGGASFAQALTGLDLVDEYRLITRPVVLGGGLPLFGPSAAPHPLNLLDVKTFPCGTAVHSYRRSRP